MANNIGFEAIRQDLGNFENEKVKHNTNTVDTSTDAITNILELNVKFEQLDAQIVTIFSSLQTIQTQLQIQANNPGLESTNESFATLQAQVSSLATTLNSYETRIKALEDRPNVVQTQLRIDQQIQLEDLVSVNKVAGVTISTTYSNGYVEQYFYDDNGNTTKINYIKDGVTKAYINYTYVLEDELWNASSSKFTQL